MLNLQQRDARLLAGGYGVVVPQADLHLAYVCLTQQQHAQAALADAAAHGQGQGAVQQHLVEGQFRTLRAAGFFQLAAQRFRIDTDTHAGQFSAQSS